MEMQLDVFTPPIASYIHHANMLSIIDLECGNSSTFEPWFSHNFIQLQCPLDLSTNRESQLDFCHETFTSIYEDFLDIQRFHRTFIERYEGGLLTFLKDQLNEGYYVELVANEYEMEPSIYYQKTHMDTNMLIFGYNLEKAYFLARFYTTDTYNTCEVSFEQMLQAFYGVQHHYYWSKYARLLKYDVNYSIPEFNMERFTICLSNYLASTNPLHHDAAMVYGIRTYGKVMEYYSALSRNQTAIDYRPVSVLYEHKKCLVRKARFLHATMNVEIEPHILDSLQELEKAMVAIRNLTIKYSISKDTRLLQKIIDSLAECRDKEAATLEKLSNRLSLPLT
ncbi:hypothetical protein DUZ99_02760 [Xylanibacillus composti]|uniref:Uncharacterized protein n=1 Tax=Xylanibacillus composti TaxID=1572762 RepID=A0A8J4GYY4_9BACL|nr:hypothetical protein [Xylanibacillus composti]MDT9723918.1 hypothetical protein [Xylanibacillus composti]GIQ67798.1 hypothetical protein XYCOK13_06220 [Xylanibacillus composti]